MSGHVPDWVRKNHGKVAKMADGGEAKEEAKDDKRDDGPRQSEDPRGPQFSVSGTGSSGDGTTAVGGRLGGRFPLSKDSDLDVGVSGHAVRGKEFKDARVDGVDATYRKKDHSFSLSVGKDEAGGNRVMLGYRKQF